eukprot:SAG31_NODE_431_length_15775_cov_3.350663_7_plen_167_part_00
MIAKAASAIMTNASSRKTLERVALGMGGLVAAQTKSADRTYVVPTFASTSAQARGSALVDAEACTAAAVTTAVATAIAAQTSAINCEQMVTLAAQIAGAAQETAKHLRSTQAPSVSQPVPIINLVAQAQILIGATATRSAEMATAAATGAWPCHSVVPLALETANV